MIVREGCTKILSLQKSQKISGRNRHRWSYSRT